MHGNTQSTVIPCKTDRLNPILTLQCITIIDSKYQGDKSYGIII